jgi:ribonuclease P protein subunit POP4
MKVTPDIIRYEFIGTHGQVAASLNMDCVGVGGTVVGETRNSFLFQAAGRPRRVIKESSTFDFTFNDGTVVEIDGKLLVGRPEDRLKKNMKRLW